MEQKQTIVAIVGMAGSGKSEVSAYLKQKGFTILRFGDETDRGVKELNLELNEKNERLYREKLRSELGMSAMAQKIEPRIIEALQKNHLIALDGLYSWEEYLFLKEKFPNLILLDVYARPLIRYERLSKRPVRPLTAEQARMRDIAEIENLHKGGPIAFADYLLMNNESNIEQLHNQIDVFLSTYEIN